ncbi:MAG: hypothetical protein JWR07_444 [Nevskia sp.]|nr:hypothetical protein [Nevskia sp.]
MAHGPTVSRRHPRAAPGGAWLRDRRWKQLNALVRFVCRSCGDERRLIVSLKGIDPDRLTTRGEYKTLYRRFEVLVLVGLVCRPLLAQAQDIAAATSTMTAIHGFLQCMAIRTLAAIVVIGVGITPMMGRMRWAWTGSVIGGDQFVSFFTTSAGS